MKPSRYNHFFEISDGITLAFNAATGALVEIEQEHLPRIQHLLKHPDQAQSDLDREFLGGLSGAGYLVGDGIDEMEELEGQANLNRISNATLSLTIAPTLACNFSCDYCYENRSAVIISDETQKALLDFADNKMSQASKLLITWFGGEPTLCMPIVERLQRRFLEMAQNHQAQVEPTSMITNGYLLDGKTAKRMKDLGITDIQITIDGPPEVHDRRRKLRNGQGTFERIMDNLAESVIEILRDRGILSKVKVYFAQVQSAGISCADIRDRCYGHDEFAQSQVQLYKNLISKGIYHVEYPQASGGVTCGAVSNNSFVISPTGHLFKCWEELSLDPAQSVGDIFSEETTPDQTANFDKFNAWDPFVLSECRDCTILPICLGGCPIHGMKSVSDNRGACSPYKFNLREMLELRYLCEAARETQV